MLTACEICGSKNWQESIAKKLLNWELAYSFEICSLNAVIVWKIEAMDQFCPFWNVRKMFFCHIVFFVRYKYGLLNVVTCCLSLQCAFWLFGVKNVETAIALVIEPQCPRHMMILL